MKKSYSFKTQRGANVDLTVEIMHITETENIADHNFTNKVSQYEYNVDSITVNGKNYNGKFANLAYNIEIGKQGNQPILVAVPQEIINDFLSNEKNEAEQKVNKMLEAEKRYQEHTSMVEKAMNM